MFGLLMRLTSPLAIVPSAKTGPDHKHALEALWRRWVFRLRGFDRFSHYMLSALPKLWRGFRRFRSVMLPAVVARGSVHPWS